MAKRNKAGVTLTDDKEITINRYEPNEKEAEVIGNIYKRFDYMKSARATWESIWNDADKAYRQYAVDKKTGDWRSNIVIPMTFATIEASLSELEDSTMGIIVRPVEDSDERNTKVMQAIIDYTWKKGDGDVEWNKTVKSALIRGSGIGKEIYRVDHKTTKEIKSYDPETQVIEWNEKDTFEFNDVYYMNIDLFDFYIDDMANDRGMDSARDCIEREIIDIGRFKEKYANYKNIEYVTAGGDTTKAQYYDQPEDTEKKEIEVLHYYNQIEDLYLIVANRILITDVDRPLPWSHKKLPFVAIVDYGLLGEFYGWGEPKILEGLQAEINTIRRMATDNTHLQINKMFFVSDSAVMDEDDLVSRPGGQVVLYGDVDKAIKWLDYPPLGQDWIKLYEELKSDFRRVSGVSEEMNGLPQSQTATQAAILRETGMKRIRYKNKYFKKKGMIPFGRMRIANIQQFYETGKVQDIVGDKGDVLPGKKYRQIRVDMKNGMYFFEATPEKIRGNFDIEVDAENIVPISKALMRQQELELYDRTLKDQTVDPKKRSKKLYEAYDKNPYDYLAEPKTISMLPEEQIKIAEEHHAALMQGYEDVVPLDNPTPEHIGAHMHLMADNLDKIEGDPKIKEVLLTHVEAEKQIVEGQQVPQGMPTDAGIQQATGGTPPTAPQAQGPMGGMNSPQGQQAPQMEPQLGNVASKGMTMQ